VTRGGANRLPHLRLFRLLCDALRAQAICDGFSGEPVSLFYISEKVLQLAARKASWHSALRPAAVAAGQKLYSLILRIAEGDQ
jgi:hypothetical protein